MSGSAKAKIFWGFLIAVAVIWIVGALWLDSIIAVSIRKVGSYVTGTKVNVTSVSLKIFSGKLAIKGFTVDNPDGYRAERLISVGDFFVDLDMGTLFGNKLVIEQLKLDKVNIDYEPNLAGKSNFTALLDNINSKSSGKDNKAGSTKKGEEKGAQKKVVIKQLTMSESSLSVSSSALRSTLKLNLPTIKMTNVGEGKNLAQTIADFFNRLLVEITKVFDFNKFGDQLKETGEQILNKIDKATDTVGGAVVSAGDSAGNAVNDAIKRSKNLVRGTMPGMGN